MPQLYLATDVATRNALQRRYDRGELTRVRQGVYVDSTDEAEIDATLLQEWSRLANYLFTDPIAVYRTAVKLKPHNQRVYLMVASGKARSVKVGPLTLSIETGDIINGVEYFSLDMQRSNLARQLLENVKSNRTTSGFKKKLGREWVESELLHVLERRGEEGLNQLREEMAHLAPLPGLEKQQQEVSKMISALLKTHPTQNVLHTRASIAQVDGKPFDVERVQRFALFAVYLAKLDLSISDYNYDKAGWRHLTFFESYFSNYIEGTQFTLDEAEEIVSTDKALYQRHEDSHDLLAHIDITSDHLEMTRVPDSPEDLIATLKSRHSILLAQRPSKRPGEFKQKENQAGATHFVLADRVEGTLVQGFEFYSRVAEGIKRALFMHFLIAEVHPFDDGNGRIARIMMNAELVATDQHKIIVPTVCRENYLGGLRQATRQSRFRTMAKVLHQLQQYSAAIPWSEYNDAKALLISHAADRDADEGLMMFNKQLSKFSGDYQADSV
jgi:hypothetical protein